MAEYVPVDVRPDVLAEYEDHEDPLLELVSGLEATLRSQAHAAQRIPATRPTGA